MPASVLDARGVELDGKMYTVGGKTPSGPINTVYVYDPATDSWSTAPAFPGVAVEDLALTSYAGELYAFGGATSPFTGHQDQAWKFDPASDTWTALASMPSARSAMAVGVIDDKIYLAGGMDSTGASVDGVLVYDPVADTWSSGPAMLERRDNAGAGVHDGKLYVFGGRTRNANGSVVDGTLASMEIFDPAAGTWSAGPPMPTGRRTFAVGYIGGRFQVMGGENAPDGSAFASNEEFDPVTATWRLLMPMSTPRHGAAAATIADVVYVTGGGTLSGASFSPTVEAFAFPSLSGG
jgi:N-acetylneuraminic acid mutarotase